MKQKYWNLSTYRLIACLLILAFHIFYIFIDKQLSFEYLLSKPVQGLMALSGFLYAGRLIESKKKFYVNNIVKILLPAIYTLSVFALYNLVFMLVSQNYNYFSLWTGHRPFDNRFIMQFDNYYFLGYLLICYILTPFITKKGHLRRIIIAVIAITEITLAFFFGTAPIAIAYFIGYLIGEKFKDNYVKTDVNFKPHVLIQWVLLSALSFVVFVLCFFVFKSDAYFLKHLINAFDQVAMTFFGVATFFLFIYIFRFMNRIESIPFLAFTDKASYYVYLFNQAFMIGGMNVTLYVNDYPTKIVLIVVFTLTFASVLTFVDRLIPLGKKLLIK